MAPKLPAQRAPNSSAKSNPPERDEQLSSSAKQLEATLALGSIIASSKPSAGSRLVASELRNLSNTIQKEASSLRNEVVTLSNTITKNLGSSNNDDSFQQSSRWPIFSLAGRRLPFFRRSRRFQTARKSVTNAATNTNLTANPGATATVNANVQSQNQNPAAAKAPQAAAAKQTVAQKGLNISPDTLNRMMKDLEDESDEDSSP